MFKFNPFATGVRNHNRSTWKKGFLPYVKKSGFLGTKSYLIDHSSSKVNRLTENFNNLKNRASDQSDIFLNQQASTWADANMKDARDEIVTTAFKEALNTREEGTEALMGAMSERRDVASTSEALTSFNKRVEGFAQARKKLKTARDTARRGRGSIVSYDETGYEKLDARLQDFYDQFDASIEERREAYYNSNDPSNLGLSYQDWKTLTEDEFYSMTGSMYDYIGGTFTEQQQERFDGDYEAWSADRDRIRREFFANQQFSRTVGNDVMVLSDILGQDSADIYFLATGGVNDFDITEILRETRENFAQLGMSSVEGAATMARFEDENRGKFAELMKRERLKNQKLLAEENDESIAVQLNEINRAEQAAKDKLDEQTAALTAGAPSRKKKVKGVSFTDTRPQ